MREKRLLWNTITSVINQITTIVCAFILPRLILSTFGSEVNGLVSSIQQFLAVITFLDMGIGAVVQSSLYKPLAHHDDDELSQIMVSANSFFRKLAAIIIVYVGVLVFAYPVISNQSFDSMYTGTLILAMSISYFIQYYFGLRNQLLLIADQRGYIYYALSSLVLILNNVCCVILIKLGFSIQIVKLTTSLTMLVRPLSIDLYVKKHYKIDWKVKLNGEPIKQKWNGIAQHLATVVLNSTDTIVLTVFSSLKNVSIYNVYYLVLNGLKNLIISFSNGFMSYFGNLIANREYSKLLDVFETYESIYHAIITYIFGCTTVLIMPFVQVYTKSVTDVNYLIPSFAYLISFANMAYCFRSPYNSLVLAAGHYKQTQNSAWIEMILNIVISIATVIKFGLIGVAVGTLIAMVYRTVYLAWYTSKKILKRRMKTFFVHMLVDCLYVISIMFVSNYLKMSSITYFSWLLLAIKVALFNLIICVLFNFIVFYNSVALKQITMLKRGR